MELNTYREEVFDYLEAFSFNINHVSGILGVSASAIAGAIAEEYHSQLIHTPLTLQYWANAILQADVTISSHEDLLADYRNYSLELEEKESQVWGNALFPKSAFMKAIDKYSGYIKKIFDNSYNDIGVGNINVHTAISLVDGYNVDYPGDPFGISYLMDDLNELVIRLADPNDSLSFIVAGLMIKESEGFFEAYAPFAWELFDQDYRDAISITYFNNGDYKVLENIYKRFLESESLEGGVIKFPDGREFTFPQYIPQPGESPSGGLDHLHNLDEIKSSIGSPVLSNAEVSDIGRYLTAILLREDIQSYARTELYSLVFYQELKTLSGFIDLNSIQEIGDRVFGTSNLGLAEIQETQVDDDTDSSLVGSNKNDLLIGLGGIDDLWGYAGNDQIFGGDDSDLITGGQGDDILDGGSGSDTYYYSTGDGNDTILAGHDSSDRLVINGIDLSTETITEEVTSSSSFYKDQKGNVYRFEDSSSSRDLIITVNDDLVQGSIRIENFIDGDFGLVFNDADPIDIGLVKAGQIVVDTGLDETGGTYVHNTRSERAQFAYIDDSINNLYYEADLYSDYQHWWTSGEPVTGFGVYAFEGSDLDDVLIAGQYGDSLAGMKGNDEIILNGIAHEDEAVGGWGSDIILGSDTSNLILGASIRLIESFPDDLVGDEYIESENGYFEDEGYTDGISDFSLPTEDELGDVDTLFGEGGDDRISAGRGNDLIDAGIGSDLIDGGAGNDVVLGGSGNDQILGDSSLWIQKFYKVYDPEKLDIGRYVLDYSVYLYRYITQSAIDLSYDDNLDGGSGDDIILGELGNDFITGGADNDILYGDRLNSPLIYEDITVSVHDGYRELTGDLHGNDIIEGGLGNDTIYGNGGADTLNGGDGDDTIHGDDDFVDVTYHGDDKVHGGAGADSITGGSGDDHLYGDSGADVIYGDAGSDRIYGGADDDNLYGDNNTLTLVEHSADYLDGGAGNDQLVGHGGDDELRGGAGDDTLFGDEGNDLLHGGDGIDQLVGGIGDDVIIGGHGNDTLWGEDGNDTLDGGVGTDIITGGNGDDILYGSGEGDSLYGDAGNDTLHSNGADYLNGGEGNDTYILSSGSEATIDDELGLNTFQLGSAVYTGALDVSQNSSNTTLSLGGGSFVTMSNAAFSNLALTDRFDADVMLTMGEEQGHVWSSTLYIDGSRGSDNIFASDNFDAFLEGKAGDDVFYSSSKISYIDGGDGDDTYNVQLGHGLVIVSDRDGELDGGYDSVLLGEGISRDDIEVRLYHDYDVVHNLRIYERSSGLLIAEVQNYLNEPSLLEEISFTDPLVSSIYQAEFSGLFFETSDLNDHIYANDVNTSIDGLGGDDVLYASSSANSHLIGGAGNDVLNGDDFNDVLDGGLGDDTLSGGYGDDVLNGGVGNDNLAGGYGTDILNGGAGDDTLSGYLGINDIAGGTGNDTINVSSGDRVHFNIGDGHDVINGYGYHLIFNEAIVPSDIQVSLVDYEDFVILFKGYPDDSIRLTNVRSHPSGSYSNEHLLSNEYHFSDGTVLTFSDLIDLYQSGSDQDDTIYGDAGDNLLQGQAGEDRIIGNEGNDTIYGGADRDDINGNEGNDIIFGGAGDDLISGDGGDDVVSGGLGDDYLRLGDGNNIIKFSLGDGHDSVSKSSVSQWNNVLEFQADITQSDINIYRSYSSLIIEIPSTGDQIRFNGHFDDPLKPLLNSVQFVSEPGTVLSAEDISTMVHEPSDLDNWLEAEQSGSTLDGLGGNDWLMGSIGDDTLYGSDGDDVLNGSDGNDILDGGSGNDSLNGGIGQFDSYRFGIGYDQDTVNNYASRYYVNTSTGRISPVDEVRFLSGINPEDLVLSKDGDDLVFSISTTTDQLTIKNAFIGGDYYTRYAVDRYYFDSDSSFYWDFKDVAILALEMSSTEGDDVITAYKYNEVLFGGGGNDVLNGGAGDDSLYGEEGNDLLVGSIGNDLLVGGSGNDTYSYSGYEGSSHGHDVIDNASASSSDIDVLEITSFDSSNAVVHRWYDDLIIDVGSGSVTLSDYFTDTANRLDKVIFDDAIEWFESDLLALSQGASSSFDYIEGSSLDDILDGKEGDDAIFGLGGNDVLIGGLGDDTLDGGSGNDTYRYTVGDGNDVITNTDNSNGRVDILQIHGVLPENVDVRRWYDDLKLDVGTETITLSGSFNGDLLSDVVINEVHFDDGTIWSSNDLYSQSLMATDGNDYLVGSSSSDVIEGLSGNDILIGNQGDDTLTGGQGSDIYLYELGDGNDIIDTRDDSSSVDTIEFGSSVTPDDVTPKRTANDDLLLTLSHGQVVTVLGYFSGAGVSSHALSAILFSDGTSWNSDTILTKSRIATDGDDYLVGRIYSDTMNGGLGNDTLIGLDHNDYLYGEQGDDVLDGGTGNDLLQGGDGSDTYVFGFGYGQDTIQNTDTSSGRYDVIRFQDDVVPQDIKIAQIDENLVLSITQTGDQLTVENHFTTKGKNSGSFIDAIEFSDGTVWDFSAINGFVQMNLQGDYSLVGDSGDNELQGFGGNDTLTGNAGDDVLSGGAGNDVYHFGRYDGKDVIDDIQGINTVEFDSTVLTTDLQLIRKANDDLILKFDDSNEVFIERYFSENTINEIKFSDGAVWSVSDVVAMTVPNTAPVTITDDINTDEDISVQVSVASLLSNDSDAEGQVLNILSVQNAQNGLVEFDEASGLITFTPDENYSGIGSFEYIVSDGVDETVGTANIHIAAVNDNPDALADNLQVDVDSILITSETALLANDSDVDGDVLTIVSVNNAVNGSVSWDGVTGSIQFTPNAGFSGQASFEYVVSDGVLNSTAAVVINVAAPNANPEAVQDDFSAVEGDTVVLTESQLLANDSDADGDSLTILGIQNVKNGDVAFDDGANTFTVSTDQYFTGDVTFEYLVSDGLASSVAQAVVTFSPDPSQSNTIMGTSGADTLIGSRNADVIYGLDGNDTLTGDSKNDRLYGGKGDDLLSGDVGSDTYVFGENDGVDTIDNSNAGKNDVDSLHLVGELAPETLWFQQQGNDLLVDVIGTNDQVVIKDWYTSQDAQIDQMFADDQVLYANDVDQLVNAMASFTAPQGVGAELTQDMKDQLNPVIAATWQSV